MSFSETHQVFGRNYAVRLPRIAPLSQTTGNAISLRFFWIKNRKKLMVLEPKSKVKILNCFERSMSKPGYNLSPIIAKLRKFPTLQSIGNIDIRLPHNNFLFCFGRNLTSTNSQVSLFSLSQKIWFLWILFLCI